MDSPFFSVIIPVYNKDNHLNRSISSVLSQEFKNFEIIAVDDASTDNSLSELKKFNDPRFKIISRDKPGPGGYAARNLGVNISKGEWIAFLDADDEWEANHLSSYKNIIEYNPEASILSSSFKNIYNDNLNSLDDYTLSINSKNIHYVSFEDYLRCESKGLRPICTSVACLKKSVLVDSGLFPEGKMVRGGDVDTWLRTIEKAQGLFWSPHIGAIYFRNSQNMVTKTSWSTPEGTLRTIKVLKEKYRNNSEIMNLLKKFSNMRVLSSWKLNLRSSNKKNFFLIRYLYLSQATYKDLVWILISLLPLNLAAKLLKNK